MTDRESIRLDMGNKMVEFKMAPLQSKIETAIALKKLLRGVDKSERIDIIRQIYDLSGLKGASRDISVHNLISWPQAREMAEAGFEIGAHTVTHCVLTNMKTQDILAELSGAKEAIEQKINRHVRSFSYPNGEYNKKIMELVKSAGYHCALSSDYGLNDVNADVYCLKRIVVTDNFSDTFFYLFLHPRLYTVARKIYGFL